MKKKEDGYALILGKYELGRLLGEGSFGKVYLGRELSTGEHFAVKVLSKEITSRDSALVAQIQREISVLRHLHHPNIVSLREVMATRSRIFIIMEYVSGGDLFSRVASCVVTEQEARKYFQQLISAIDFCHSRGIFHRDLKPENLLIDHNGDLKVSDFGLSALPEQAQAHPDGLLHTQCGSPAYVAPEVLLLGGYDGAKADVWSCGVILFVMLSGYLPFFHENVILMYRKIITADYYIPSWVSADARRLISRLLDSDADSSMSISAIMQDPWFKKGLAFVTSPPPEAVLEPEEIGEDNKIEEAQSPRFYNAFELIASMSSGFDLSGMFEGRRKSGEMFTSRRSASEIMEALQNVGRALGFVVQRMKGSGYRLRMEGKEGRKGKLTLTAEVFKLAPEVALVGFSLSSGDTLEYAKFYHEDIRPGLKDIVWTWQGEAGSGDSGRKDCSGTDPS